MNALEDFRSALNGAGLPFSGLLFDDGKLHRFNADGESGQASWYVLHRADRFAAGAFGCWRRQLNQSWNSSNGAELSPEERRELRQRLAAAQAQHKTEEQKVRSEAVLKAAQILSAASPATPDHPYLARKHVTPHGELRVITRHPASPALEGCLVLPLRDTNGSLHTLEFIAPDQRFGGKNDPRDKQLLFGGDPKAHFFTISDRPDGPLVLCEGYATGASIYEATGFATVCARNAGNLLPTALALRAKFPNRTLIVAADNDRFTHSPPNPGLTAATQAAKATKGIVAVPEFADEDTRSTDFNDKSVLEGFPAVAAILQSAAESSGDWSFFLQSGSVTAQESIPDPVELVSRLITERSKVVIGGSSKSYKTWFALDMALALASGQPFLNYSTSQSIVLYVNLELKESTFKRRVQIVAQNKGLANPVSNSPLLKHFFHVTLRGRLASLKSSEIVSRIIQLSILTNAKAVFLDPIYKINLEGDENNSRDQTILFNQLDRITTQANAALIFCDHFSKGNQSEKDPLDAIRGSSAKGGDVDAAIIIRPHKEKSAFCVDVVHRELPPVDPFAISWAFPAFSKNDDLDAADLKKPKSPGRPQEFDLLTTLSFIANRDSSNPVSQSEWATLAGIKRTTLVSHLHDFRNRNLIASVGEGNNTKIIITQKGKNCLSDS